MGYEALELLDQLGSEEVDWIISNATPLTLLASATLIQDGTPGGYIYLITDGLFDVLVRNAFGQELRVAQLGAGQIVGEISWLDRQPYSATIKAAESSSVLALQTSILDQKIEADTAFASRFFRALARISFTRLRARSALFADPKLLEEDRPSPHSSSGLGGVLYERLAQFKEQMVAADQGAVKAKGPVPDDLRNTLFANFRSLSQELTEKMCSNELASSDRTRIGKMVQRELLPYVHLSSFAERCYSKPRGYAGDYLTIEMMYNNEPSGTGRIGPIIDECMLREPPCQAARNRRHLLSGQINQTMRSTNGRAHIMSLACGPGREIFDALSGSALDAVDVTALDIDQDALGAVKKQSEQQGIPVRVLHGNLIYLAAGRQPPATGSHLQHRAHRLLQRWTSHQTHRLDFRPPSTRRSGYPWQFSPTQSSSWSHGPRSGMAIDLSG